MKKYTLLFPLFIPFSLAETVIEHNTDPVSFERHSQAVKFEQDFVKNHKKRSLINLNMHSIRLLNSKLIKQF